MRQITSREKILLGSMAVVIIAILVYFVFLPMMKGKDKKAGETTADVKNQNLSMEEMQAKLETMQKLASMEPLLVKAEERMKMQSGYEEVSFKRGIADAAIIKFIDDTARKAGIEKLDQIGDPKLETAKKTTTAATTITPNVVNSMVDQLYLSHVIQEMEQTASGSDQGPDSNTEQANSDESNQEEKQDVPQDSSQQMESSEPLFPPIPEDIPFEIKQALVNWLQANQGRTMGTADMVKMLDQVKIDDEQKKENITRQLSSYRDSLMAKKNELIQWFNKMDMSLIAQTQGKTDSFSVRVTFKSQMDQLVKFLYYLQSSAKWIRIDGIRISISDPKETILLVDLTMTANVLYEE